MVWFLHAWLVDQDMEYLVDDPPGVRFYLLAASVGQRSRYWGTQQNWEGKIEFSSNRNSGTRLLNVTGTKPHTSFVCRLLLMQKLGQELYKRALAGQTLNTFLYSSLASPTTLYKPISSGASREVYHKLQLLHRPEMAPNLYNNGPSMSKKK
jgi:hypothetical protein